MLATIEDSNSINLKTKMSIVIFTLNRYTEWKCYLEKQTHVVCVFRTVYTKLIRHIIYVLCLDGSNVYTRRFDIKWRKTKKTVLNNRLGELIARKNVSE